MRVWVRPWDLASARFMWLSVKMSAVGPRSMSQASNIYPGYPGIKM